MAGKIAKTFPISSIRINDGAIINNANGNAVNSISTNFAYSKTIYANDTILLLLPAYICENPITNTTEVCNKRPDITWNVTNHQSTNNICEITLKMKSGSERLEMVRETTSQTSN